MALVAFPENISLEKAWSIIEERVRSLERGEMVEIADVGAPYGRILASDLFARFNLPHYPASAVDGYAIKAVDTARASSTSPSRMEPGSYIWVNTGGGVERKYDAVVMIEDTFMDGEFLMVTKMVSQGDNVRPEGEDVAMGQVIARKGEALNPLNLPLLIASGYSSVPVQPLPRTIFLPTGDEIVEIARWINGGYGESDQAPETNSWMLRGLFSEWGFPLDVGEILPDNPGIIGGAVEKALGDYDLVVIGAGTAKGRRDHSAGIISRFGEPLFRGIRMKPGRPVIAGISGNRPLVALPGFPMSALVTAWTILYPMLCRLSGQAFHTNIQKAIGCHKTFETSLLRHHSSQQGIREWMRVKCGEIDGTLYSWPLASGASSMFSISDADGVALLDESTLELPKGSRLNVWMRNDPDWKRRIVYQGSNDPAIEILVSHMRDHGGDMAIRSVGSLGGLAAISRGEGHVASCHLLNPEDGTYNSAYINGFSGSGDWVRIRLFRREQGLIVYRGNPLGIGSVKDLSITGAFFVNRQPGAGTRVLFDHLLKENDIVSGKIKGYNSIAVTHLEASARVGSGSADATLGIRAAADAFGNDFVPVTMEDFELIIPGRFMNHDGISILIETLDDANWRLEVENLGGYSWII